MLNRFEDAIKLIQKCLNICDCCTKITPMTVIKLQLMEISLKIHCKHEVYDMEEQFVNLYNLIESERSELSSSDDLKGELNFLRALHLIQTFDSYNRMENPEDDLD
jgi:hypothetical protein